MAVSSKPSIFSSWLVVITLCSSIFVVRSQGGGAGGATLPCVQKLLPCQPYLKGSSPPTATCCVPLKEIVTSDVHCLCAVFNNPDLLKSLNVTQSDALNLAKSCGAKADTSLCGNPDAPSSTSPPTPVVPSANRSTESPPPHGNAATSISHFGGFLSLAAIFSFIVSVIF